MPQPFTSIAAELEERDGGGGGAATFTSPKTEVAGKAASLPSFGDGLERQLKTEAEPWERSDLALVRTELDGLGREMHMVTSVVPRLSRAKVAASVT